MCNKVIIQQELIFGQMACTRRSLADSESIYSALRRLIFRTSGKLS
jgi:hypothetical protein